MPEWFHKLLPLWLVPTDNFGQVRGLAMLSADRTLVAPAPFFAVLSRFTALSIGCGVGAVAVAVAGAVLNRNTQLITEYFLVVQDAPFLFFYGFLFAALDWYMRSDLAVPSPAWLEPGHERSILWATLGLVCCIVFGGAHVVQQNYPLSLDEFMADFDARIFVGGHLIAPVPAEWRSYVPALQPLFHLPVPDHTYWTSFYLPVNAMIRSAFLFFGAPALQGVVLACIALVAVYGVARRLWPDRPDAAVIATILLASSMQFLMMAMTPYAMTAHLALNMVWLWLFLRDTPSSHVMAAGVGFAACGLHQVIFHPLFVAPFMISLVMARRWRTATFYAVAYSAIGLFWLLYWSLLLRVTSATVEQSTGVGLGYLLKRLSEWITFDFATIALMSANLFRFLVWQNPLLILLAFVGLFICRTRNGAMGKLALGIAFTLAAMSVLMPFQGHGWGYRYLHGLLGGVALMAAQGWIWFTDHSAHARNRLAFAVLASVAVSVFVLLPWRAHQVYVFVNPYAAASKAIASSKADVVVIDATDIWYGMDLARNDPFLRNSPKVLDLTYLREQQVRELCGRGTVDIFGPEHAQQLGLRVVRSVADDLASENHRRRELMRSLGCGRSILSLDRPTTRAVATGD